MTSGLPMPIRTRLYSLPMWAVIERSPLWLRDAAADFYSDFRRLQIDFVVENHDAARIELVEICGLPTARPDSFIYVPGKSRRMRSPAMLPSTATP